MRCGKVRINTSARRPERSLDLTGLQDEDDTGATDVGTPSDLAAMILSCQGQHEALMVLADWLEQKLGLAKLADLLRSPELKPLPMNLRQYEAFDYFPLERDAFFWLALGRNVSYGVTYRCRYRAESPTTLLRFCRHHLGMRYVPRLWKTARRRLIRYGLPMSRFH